MQSVYLQRIMKKNAAKGYEKTKPKQSQFKPNLVRRRRIPKGQNELKIACQKIRPHPRLCKAQLFITIGIIGQIILKINK
jgi:hypothetical protein